MSYVVFARKYRPKRFDEIVGQPHITTTLTNAILQNRVAHAYLFSGPRGVGKTTTARILAKALNCEKVSGAEPCSACSSCVEITQGVSMEVLEIDGASNRGIDEIRNLKENVKFSPAKGKFKVYIIDEVHMLTPEAFNALLKTLEEPPAHVKFIFATTQPHKVPPTIISRCQRFDFRRITAKDILANLKEIAKDEKLNARDGALAMIARCADGSLRDGQVILDQMLSFAPGAADAGDVARLLGAVSDDALFALAGAIKAKDAACALAAIDGLINDGKDASRITLGLIEHFRNLSVAKISSHPEPLLDADPERIRSYREQARVFTVEEMLYIIYTLSGALDLIRRSSLARIPLEVAMVKLATFGPIAPPADIMDRIEKLEERLRGQGSSAHLPAEPPVRDHGRPPEPVETGERKGKDKGEGPGDEPASAVGIDEVLGSWSEVINRIKAKKISIASYLQEGYPASLEEGVLTVAFSKEFQFHKEVLESAENKRLIEHAIQETLKREMKVTLTLVEPVNAKGNPALKGAERGSGTDDGAGADETAQKNPDPIIETALEIFGGEVSRRKKEGA